MLVQGEAPREALLNRFRELGNAVLLATGSFWEGVDVKGEALSIVAIDKLPFASPDDPLLKARLEGIRRRGGNPFFEYQLPQAVLALKQGVGRLIRDFDDFGGDRARRSSPPEQGLWPGVPRRAAAESCDFRRRRGCRVSPRTPERLAYLDAAGIAGDLERMRVLAIDTATEACSVALLIGEELIGRYEELGKTHAQQILAMVDSVLAEAQISLNRLDGLAASIGPGAFTGVRISVAVAQGLAFGANLRVAAVTTLEALAFQALDDGTGRALRDAGVGHALACLDARMGEVYWGCFAADRIRGLRPVGASRVGPPESVSLPGPVDGPEVMGLPAGTFAGLGARVDGGNRYRGIGRGFAAYPTLATLPGLELDPSDGQALPNARHIARLGALRLAAGEALDPADLQPLYLRDKVALTEAERRQAKAR